MLFGAFMFLIVANARLSDRFRAAEYKERLRTVGIDSGERPDFVPQLGESAEDFSGEQSEELTGND
jgi:hypothetical protein